MQRRRSVKGAFSGKLPDNLEDTQPRFRLRKGERGNPEYVYAYAHKRAANWIVFCPGKWAALMFDADFGEQYVASNEEGRRVARIVAERNDSYRIAYGLNR